jgi:hypothetical protein
VILVLDLLGFSKRDPPLTRQARLAGCLGVLAGKRKSNWRVEGNIARPVKVKARCPTDGLAHIPAFDRRRRAIRIKFHACAASPQGYQD